MFLIHHVTSHDHMFKGLCDLMDLVAIGHVEVVIQQLKCLT